MWDLQRQYQAFRLNDSAYDHQTLGAPCRALIKRRHCPSQSDHIIIPKAYCKTLLLAAESLATALRLLALSEMDERLWILEVLIARATYFRKLFLVMNHFKLRRKLERCFCHGELKVEGAKELPSKT